MFAAVSRAPFAGMASTSAKASSLRASRVRLPISTATMARRTLYTPLTLKPYDNLVRMQQSSCAKWPAKDMFGVKTATGEFKWISYGEFARMVDSFRGALAGLGVAPGDKVAVISNNRLEWAVGAYATYSIGAHYVPMYEAQLPKDWSYIIGDSGAVVALVANEKILEITTPFIGNVGKLRHVIAFDNDPSKTTSYGYHLLKGAKNSVAAQDPKPDDIATLIYTSGTTGKPKGVMLTHHNIASNVAGLIQMYNKWYKHDDVSLAFLPWAHAYGQTCELHTGMQLGTSIGISGGAEHLLHELKEVKPTILFAVPQMWNRVFTGINNSIANGPALTRTLFKAAMGVAARRNAALSAGKTPDPITALCHKLADKVVLSRVRERFGGELKLSISGGAALSPPVHDFFNDLGITMVEGYGLTETSPILGVQGFGLTRQLQGGLRALPGIDLVIADLDGNIVPDGEEGELCANGPNIMKGYHNLPEATTEAFRTINGKSYFRTGDLARFQPDGAVKLTGRVKEQYKLTNGKYVVPVPIEDAITVSRFFHQAFVYGENQTHNIALVVPDYGALVLWAKENGVSPADASSVDGRRALLAHPTVSKFLMDECLFHISGIKHYEQPRAFKFLTEEFTVINGLLTPKLSMKRKVIADKFKDEIRELYSKPVAAKHQQRVDHEHASGHEQHP